MSMVSNCDASEASRRGVVWTRVVDATIEPWRRRTAPLVNLCRPRTVDAALAIVKPIVASGLAQGACRRDRKDQDGSFAFFDLVLEFVVAG